MSTTIDIDKAPHSIIIANGNVLFEEKDFLKKNIVGKRIARRYILRGGEGGGREHLMIPKSSVFGIMCFYEIYRRVPEIHGFWTMCN